MDRPRWRGSGQVHVRGEGIQVSITFFVQKSIRSIICIFIQCDFRSFSFSHNMRTYLMIYIICSEDRMRNGCKKLTKARHGSTQGRLDSFFKVTHVTPSNKRKVWIGVSSFLTCSLYTNPDICICCRSTWRTGQDGAAVVCREVWFAHTHLSLDVGLEARVAHLLEARVALLHLCLDVNASSCHQYWHFSVSLGSSRMWGKEQKVCTIAHVRFSLLIILSLNSEWWLCPISWVTSPSRCQSVTSVSSWDPGLSSGGQWQWWGTSFQIISSAHTRSFKWGTIMGDKLSDIFIRLLYQVFQIGDAQPPQKAHIGAQVFQTSLLV